MTVTRQEVQSLVDRHAWWYHAMNLGHGVTTPGQYGDNLLPVASLMARLDLKGSSCLDIGTMDGKMAFLAEKLGGDVVTADVFKRDTVTELIQLFSSSVKYVPGIRDSNLMELAKSFGRFDFVLCAGVLYHIFSPIDLIANARQVVKNNGYAVFESACIKDERKSYMRLNWGDVYKEHTTLWVPTIACLRSMLRYFSFEIVGDAILKGRVPRYAVLCRARKPSEMGVNCGDAWLSALLLKQTPGLSSEYLLPQLDIDGFETAPVSAIPDAEPCPRRRVLWRRRPRHHSVESALLERATPNPEI